MAISNHERVGKALEHLRSGLGPFVERELTNRTKLSPKELGPRFFYGDAINSKKLPDQWDVSALLIVMWDSWNDVFKATLGYAERNLVSELRTIRNDWAHQQNFNFDNTYRALDSIERLLNAISAEVQAREVAQSKAEILRLKHEEQSRYERRKVSSSSVESQGSIAIPAWRDVISPHQDVATGNYQKAEFAADLWQVYCGEGSEEYRDPVEFYKRTFLTHSLTALLEGGLKRIAGIGGDPVIQLQTNFGGGKTHAMLALYHLLSGITLTKLPGIEDILKNVGLAQIPSVKRVVLVGTQISASTPRPKGDGVEVHTLWGELAYQLGGKEAYDQIAEDDINATSPGDKLRQLLQQYGPCLILIDEWVAYARQLHDDFDLRGGNFETQFTFAQTLTESVTATNNTLLVVSLPASDGFAQGRSFSDDMEVGGERGRVALERLKNVVGRVESTWSPASAEESFEIVRRRLFSPLVSQEQFVKRDAVAKAFSNLYNAHPNEFPPETKEQEYEKRIRDAYPIHPEVFERLYTDWSTLAKFQRTRGVLRLMATVIYDLWKAGNSSPLILPAHISMDDGPIRSELVKYLDDSWKSIIDKDVDGSNSLPVRIDNEIPDLGRYLACARVTRTIFLGSAPTVTAANKGIDSRRVKLGSVMPGESPGKFDDALRRLSSAATYLYEDQGRYWYDTQPTVNKLVEDRAEQLKGDPDSVSAELKKRLKSLIDTKNEFAGIHLMPSSGADIPDEFETRLVILGPDDNYVKDPNQKSSAEKLARQILGSRGTAPRRYQNTLVFLAADQNGLIDLDASIRRYLAWQSVLNDREDLNLAPFHVRQAENQKANADESVKAQLPEAYQWLLVPVQKLPTDEVSMEIQKLSGRDDLVARAVKKLRNDELMLPSMGGTRLRMELDRIPLWAGDSVSIKTLVEYFASYIYLPRLMSPSVIYRAVESGVRLMSWKDETFAYAEGFEQVSGQYQGLIAGASIAINDGDQGLLVKPDVASKQLDLARNVRGDLNKGYMSTNSGAGAPDPSVSLFPSDRSVPAAKKVRRYHASVDLSPERSTDASRIYNEVIAHLRTAEPEGVTVKVTLEIEATDENGFPDTIVRIVSENGASLKFRSQGFEED